MNKKNIKLLIICSMVVIAMTLCACSNIEFEKDTEVQQDLNEINIDNEQVIDSESNVDSIDSESDDSDDGDKDNSLYDFSVITIGTGTPEYSNIKANASTAIKYNDKYFIIDCGDGSYANLMDAEFDFRNIAGIFFTHHHIDHTGDFFDIYIKCLQSNNKLSVVGPARTQKFVDFVSDVYLDDILYRKLSNARNSGNLKDTILESQADVVEIIGQKTFQIDGITITTAQMTHTMYDLAYKFESDGNCIVVSGDTSFDEDLITLSKDADILVIDGGLYKKKTNEDKKEPQYIEPFYENGGDMTAQPHLSFDDMVKIATQADVKKLVITHFPQTTENRIESSIAKAKESFNGEVIYAQDMMQISVDLDEKEQTSSNNMASLPMSYPIVDTGQVDFYSDSSMISKPNMGDAYFGQDATYSGNQPSYVDNNDGTITDQVTGLMWAQDMGEKMSYEKAQIYANEFNLGGYDDWRIPTIKELYSLILFTGTVKGTKATDKLFIDTDYFNQPLGDVSEGEREIDAQTWSSTIYVGKTMNNDATIFGVNFIDGRIKGYPQYDKRSKENKEMYFRLVRGNKAYGENNFLDNEDGTITDLATGLTWQQDDSGCGMDWQEALSYAENLELAGHDDWRLPNAKELQSIIDYNRSVQTTNSPAIDDMFGTTSMKDPDGNSNYPYFWTGTTHLDGANPYSNAAYIAFGEALGEMNGRLLDVHGAGAQRSDPKSGDAEDYPESKGPQGDIRYVYNYVRCVRN